MAAKFVSLLALAMFATVVSGQYWGYNPYPFPSYSPFPGYPTQNFPSRPDPSRTPWQQRPGNVGTNIVGNNMDCNEQGCKPRSGAASSNFAPMSIGYGNDVRIGSSTVQIAGGPSSSFSTSGNRSSGNYSYFGTCRPGVSEKDPSIVVDPKKVPAGVNTQCVNNKCRLFYNGPNGVVEVFSTNKGCIVVGPNP